MVGALRSHHEAVVDQVIQNGLDMGVSSGTKIRNLVDGAKASQPSCDTTARAV
jgi:hypothetical protein